MRITRAAARWFQQCALRSGQRRCMAASATDIQHESLKPYYITLERAVGDSLGSDGQLMSTGAFGAQVFPDLPIATTWDNLWKAMTRAPQQPQPDAKQAPEAAQASGPMRVTTVAANLRSMEDIRRRIIAATKPSPLQEAVGTATSSPTSLPQPAAGALLMVSGSHPVRNLPGSRLLLPTSITTLGLAVQLRKSGDIPAATQLWAVANPNIETDAALLERKVAASAQVILTQPPFDLAAFEEWLQDAQQRGVLRPGPSTPDAPGGGSSPEGQAALLVGIPMITSPGNLAFWLSLASCVNRRACQALLSEMMQADRQGKAALDEYCNKYNRDLIAKVLSMPGVSGVHLMPITPKAKRMVVGLIQKGVLPQSAPLELLGHTA
eukprot:CAMPEP_0202908720 /NCGR_PEP_ID=MMETSP1392-20130828/47029_1 /ASSEMBLY_ACC=CAM_ASM_000868 /TAXON_ID=225041 /ORGANISM="Chlamydomonas chlamydogama, Strain SAG 11-48b" /LENGTH=379 /DNA_ID=CAMNT_0049598191 /DNA_START=46 /DNA_END=1185 /DNA_ORIENTATION=-